MTAPPALTAGDLLSVIRHQADNAPRSLQTAIGPSQVGVTCTRRLALQLLGAPQHNTTADRWPATVGTAVHGWLAEVFTADNARRATAGEPPRWLVEQSVTVRTGLAGSCDLLDLQTMTVVDHKTVGASSLRKYRAAGDPGQQYRWQAHLYGMGWANAGIPVGTVAVVFYPRSGVLRDSWMWAESYDPAVATQALARMDELLVGMDVAEQAGALDEFASLLARDTGHCDWCPFWTADLSVTASSGCHGPLEDGAPGPAAQALAGIF